MTYATDSILQHCTAQRRIASPLGTLLLARSASGLAGAWFEEQKHHPAAIDAPERDDDPLLEATARQFDEDLAALDRPDFLMPSSSLWTARGRRDSTRSLNG